MTRDCQHVFVTNELLRVKQVPDQVVIAAAVVYSLLFDFQAMMLATLVTPDFPQSDIAETNFYAPRTVRTPVVGSGEALHPSVAATSLGLLKDLLLEGCRETLTYS